MFAGLFQCGLLRTPPPPPVVVLPTVWNASDNSGFTLSDGNLTAAITLSSGNNAVRGDQSHTTGKWYFEFKENSGILNAIGVASASQSLTGTIFSANVAIWAIPQLSAGGTWSNGEWQANHGSAITQAIGGWGGIAVDLGASLIWIRNSAGWDGDPAAGTGGYSMANLSGIAVFPILSAGSGDTCNDTANFGATAFSYTAPSGFSPWGG